MCSSGRGYNKTIKDDNCIRRLRFSTSVETTLETNDSIIVYAKLKPIKDEASLFKFSSNTVSCSDRDKKGNEKELVFSFHHVFPPLVSQKEVFDQVVSKYVKNLLEGENRLVFAYGTTSSGKTYTLLGNQYSPGIIPRCIFKICISISDHIDKSSLCPDRGCDLRTLSPEEMSAMAKHIELIEDLTQNCDLNQPGRVMYDFDFDMDATGELVDLLSDEVELVSESTLDPEARFSVWVSYVEVYNENIYDLLDTNVSRQPLKLGLDSKKDVYVKGLTHLQVNKWLTMWYVLLYGRSRLHVNKTQLNMSSSRSHSVFTLKLIKNVNGIHTMSRLTMCDLAGTERQKKAHNQGETLNESCNINTSLMILNRCFTVVRENKLSNQSKKPPYRESKLTMILQKALSYSEPMTMFVALNQSKALFEETKNVLKMSAVAQEMIKPLPKLQDRFLKPNSRFSILVSNPNTSNPSEISGIRGLSDSTTMSSGRTEKEYQEIIEEAKLEYLNLEKKLQETETKLAEELMSHEELEKEYENLEALYSNLVKKCRNYEKQIEENEKDIQQLEEENETLFNENCNVKYIMKNLKKENEKYIEDINGLRKELAIATAARCKPPNQERFPQNFTTCSFDESNFPGPLAESTFRENNPQKFEPPKETKEPAQKNTDSNGAGEGEIQTRTTRKKRALLKAIVELNDSN